jgi:hypothetical protein
MQMRIVVAAFFLFPSALFFVPQNTRVEVDRLVVYQPQRELALPAGGDKRGHTRSHLAANRWVQDLQKCALRVASIEHIRLAR